MIRGVGSIQQRGSSRMSGTCSILDHRGSRAPGRKKIRLATTITSGAAIGAMVGGIGGTAVGCIGGMLAVGAVLLELSRASCS